MERKEKPDRRYLASIWTLRLFSRHCDICKDFRLIIPAIYNRYSNLKKAESFSNSAFYKILIECIFFRVKITKTGMPLLCYRKEQIIADLGN
jgi:hypothetical protein